MQSLKADLTRYRVLVFRGQGKLSADVQLGVSKWWGTLHSTFYKHEKSPHPDVFRVSNDASEGCTRVGRSGWHIDGTFLPKPFKLQTMHFWSCNKGGSTLFCPLREVVQGLDAKTREMFKNLYFVGDRQVHPLVYPHPSSGEPTMCFHLGDQFYRCFAHDFDPADQSAKLCGDQESEAIREAIVAMLEDKSRMLELKWEVGDFALVDNLAVAHYASPATQDPVEKAGLRILHRTTVAGDAAPMALKRKK